MDMDYVKMWLKSLIKEEINKDQLRSVAARLNMKEDKLRKWVMDTDPTPNQGFGVWLLRGLKYANIQLEDGPRARAALERFIQLRRVNRIGDIMQYPHINDLENAMDALSGVGAKRQGFAGVDPSTLPGVEHWRDSAGITFYKVSDANSLAEMGEGTKWCTRKSYTHPQAQSYINRYGFLIVGYKDGKPYVQMNPDYSVIMNVDDVSFERSNAEEIKKMGLPAPPFQVPQYWDPEHPRHAAWARWGKLMGRDVKFNEPKQPTEYSLTLGGEEPRDVTLLKRWGKETGKPIKLPAVSSEFWPKFEARLAKSISRAKSYGQLLNPMRGWRKMTEYTKQRTPMVEQAIVKKNWKDIKWRYFGGGGPMRHIPGMYEIADYAKDIIKGNWPEFEKKVQTDTFNCVYYHCLAHLDPIYVTDNPTARKMIIFANKIHRKDPTVKSKEFAGELREFILESKGKLDKGEVQLFRQFVIVPYFKRTRGNMKSLLGTAYRSDKFYKLGKWHTAEPEPHDDYHDEADY